MEDSKSDENNSSSKQKSNRKKEDESQSSKSNDNNTEKKDLGEEKSNNNLNYNVTRESQSHCDKIYLTEAYEAKTNPQSSAAEKSGQANVHCEDASTCVCVLNPNNNCSCTHVKCIYSRIIEKTNESRNFDTKTNTGMLNSSISKTSLCQDSIYKSKVRNSTISNKVSVNNNANTHSTLNEHNSSDQTEEITEKMRKTNLSSNHCSLTEPNTKKEKRNSNESLLNISSKSFSEYIPEEGERKMKFESYSDINTVRDESSETSNSSLTMSEMTMMGDESSDESLNKFAEKTLKTMCSLNNNSCSTYTRIIDELDVIKKSSVSKNKYDIFVVNTAGAVKTFEVNHYTEDDSQVDPREVQLNQEIQKSTLKSKSGINSKKSYQEKVKSILSEIKEQSVMQETRESEPTIIEISQIVVKNKSSTDSSKANSTTEEIQFDNNETTSSMTDDKSSSGQGYVEESSSLSNESFYYRNLENPDLSVDSDLVSFIAPLVKVSETSPKEVVILKNTSPNTTIPSAKSKILDSRVVESADMEINPKGDIKIESGLEMSTRSFEKAIDYDEERKSVKDIIESFSKSSESLISSDNEKNEEKETKASVEQTSMNKEDSEMASQNKTSEVSNSTQEIKNSNKSTQVTSTSIESKKDANKSGNEIKNAKSEEATNKSKTKESATQTPANYVEIEISLTDEDEQSQEKKNESTDQENSTITFIENDIENYSVTLQNIRKNKVGNLVKYFENLHKERESKE